MTLTTIFRKQMRLTVNFNKDVLKELKVFASMLEDSEPLEAMDEFEAHIYNTYEDAWFIEEVLAIIQEAYEDAVSTYEDEIASEN